jgi:5'-deoxynucleotidase
MTPSHFFAYLTRMKLIDRWGLMRCTQKENVQEHSLQVAITAHALALIGNKYFGKKTNAERVALLAIFHDSTEVLTGDLPTPVKYFSPELRAAYAAIEDHAAEQLVRLLPEGLRKDYAELLTISSEEQEAIDLIKAADTICAYTKCIEETSVGNHEFSGAKKTLEEKVQKLRSLPEVDYFVTNFVPSFALSLDEMSL